MKKRGFLITGILAFSLTASLATSVFAATGSTVIPPNSGSEAIVHGHAQLDIVLTKAEEKSFRNLLYSLQEKGDKKHKASAEMKDKHHKEVDSMFQTKDGTPHLIVSLPYREVTVGSDVVVTDEKGNFNIKTKQGNQKTSLQKNGIKSYEKNITLNSGENDVTIAITTNTKNMMENMNKNMDMSGTKQSSTMDMSTTGTATPNTLSSSAVSATSSYTYPYGPFYIGERFGSNLGKMTIRGLPSYVSCNKSDYDNGYWFPGNNSDCANGIAAGLLYSNDSVTWPEYRDGEACVEESMDRLSDYMLGSVYCNGKANTGSNKPYNDYYRGYTNKGYNCSSFPFLNGDERIHNL